jgi:hypothetical protein
MNRFSVLTALFFLGSTAFSQTADRHSRPRLFSTADDSFHCPIEIRVEVGVEGLPGKRRRCASRTCRAVYICLASAKTIMNLWP